MRTKRGLLLAFLGLVVASVPWLAGAEQQEPLAPLYPSHDLKSGGIHFHTAYSDGAAGTRPPGAYAAGKAAGMDYMFVTEHSEWLALPVEADADCIDPTEPRMPQDCFINPIDEPDGMRKWDAQAEHASAATTTDYLALRGFEWSSPIQGHMGVLLSANFSDSARDIGATMHGFWSWFARPVLLGGGADGLATFNHPGREPQKFEEFRYVPDADTRTVGVEVFNRGNEYFIGGLAQALDNGWHVGAIGASDDHGDGANWGRTDRSRTVLIVPKESVWNESTVRDALLKRRFYATFDYGLELRFQSGGNEMGSTVVGASGQEVSLTVEARTSTERQVTKIELFTNTGTLVTSVMPGTTVGTLTYSASMPTSGQEKWIVAKVTTGGSVGTKTAFTSPIWLRSNP